jgi:hypothetical protein
LEKVRIKATKCKPIYGYEEQSSLQSYELVDRLCFSAAFEVSLKLLFFLGECNSDV